MLIPLSDDVKKSRFPIVGSIIVCINLLALAYTFRAFYDAKTEHEDFTLFQDYGLVPSAVTNDNQLVSFFTHMWLHAGFGHFIGNMMMLYIFMWTLEGVLGGGRFLALYLFAGLAGGLAQYFQNPDSDIPMVGASGAIAGVMGAYLYSFGPFVRIKMMLIILFKPFIFHMPAMLFMGLWFLDQVAGFGSHGVGDGNGGDSDKGGVAYACHLGGFFAGMILQILLYDKSKVLVRDGNGEIDVRDEAEREVKRKGPLIVDREKIAAMEGLEKCQFCETPYNPEDRIADAVMQCHNEDCKRLSYLTAALPPMPARRYS